MYSLIKAVFFYSIRNHAVLIILAIISIIPLLSRNKTPYLLVNSLNRNWLIILIVWVICLLPVYQHFNTHYVAFGLPFLILLAAHALSHQLQQQAPSQNHTVLQATYILLIIWMGARIAFNLINLPSSSLEDVVATGERIAPLLADDVTIVAAEPYYFGMMEQQGFVGGSVDVILKGLQALSDSEVWDYVQPDAFIFSSSWPLHPARTPAVEVYMEANDFGLAGCWETRSYGRIELWVKPQLLLDVTPQPACEFVPIPRLGR